jgi:hypothetical protein
LRGSRPPDSFWAKGRKGASNGQGSDSEGNVHEKGGGADNRSKSKGEGKGPKILGCRYINVGEVCPHGEKCRYTWAHSLAPQGPPVEFDRRPVRERRNNTPGPIVKEEISDNASIGSAASSSGSEGSEQALRGTKPKMSEWQNSGGPYTAHAIRRPLDGPNKCMNSEDNGIKEVPQFIYSDNDDDDQWWKCFPNDSDDDGTGEFLKIDYLTQSYRTYHATTKSKDDSTGCNDGNGCADSAAPSKLEPTSSAVGANDEARSIVPQGSFASIAPSKLESISSALDADEAGQPIISQCISQSTTTTTHSNDNYNNMEMDPNDVQNDIGRSLTISQDEDCAAAREDIGHGAIDNVNYDTYSNNEMEFDIENALACTEIGQTKEAVTKEKMVRKVTWVVPERDFSTMKEDKNDAYRHFYISKVLPEQRPWIPHKQWISFPTKAHARKHERDEFRAKPIFEKVDERHVARSPSASSPSLKKSSSKAKIGTPTKGYTSSSEQYSGAEIMSMLRSPQMQAQVFELRKHMRAQSMLKDFCKGLDDELLQATSKAWVNHMARALVV